MELATLKSASKHEENIQKALFRTFLLSELLQNYNNLNNNTQLKLVINSLLLMRISLLHPFRVDMTIIEIVDKANYSFFLKENAKERERERERERGREMS